jgi:hypothetical protein
MIIFSSIWFLYIKITKLKFCKIYKKTETGSNWLVSIRFGYFKLKTETQPTDLIQFGYFILKIENYIVFWAFFGFSNGFFLVRFDLVYFLTKTIRFNLVFWFQVYETKTEPNFKKKYSNRSFSWFGFFGYFFLFSWFNQFISFFVHP